MPALATIRAVLDKLYYVRVLPEEERESFAIRVRDFIEAPGRSFVGANGFKVADPHRIVIASAAVRMTQHLGLKVFSDVVVIRIHAGDLFVQGRRAAGRTALLPSGKTIVELGWSHVVMGLAVPDDGVDVTIHELAHALDARRQGFNGMPALREHQDYWVWAAVMQNHFERIESGCDRVAEVLRDYAGVDTAELFSVASEAYFERPELLEAKLPALYRKLHRFYGPSEG